MKRLTARIHDLIKNIVVHFSAPILTAKISKINNWVVLPISIYTQSKKFRKKYKMNHGPLEWYLDIPVVSRIYFTLCVATTSLVALDVISPLSLYYNLNLITEKFQIWRIFTSFLFFGNFSMDFMFHMYFSIRYCRLLEENSFSNRTLDFVFLLGYGVFSILLIAPFNFVNLPFLGPSLTFMLVYIWGRRNPQVRMNLLGLFTFTANYLAYVLLLFSVLLGNSFIVDIIGIVIGHIYFFFDDIYPELARLRQWKQKHYLRAPEWLKKILQPPSVELAVQEEDPFNFDYDEPVTVRPTVTDETQTRTVEVEESLSQNESEIDNSVEAPTVELENNEKEKLNVEEMESLINVEAEDEAEVIEQDENGNDLQKIDGTDITLKSLAEARLRRRKKE